MKLSTLFSIAVVILTATEFSSAQTTTITGKDYWAVIFSGYTASRTVYPRRETETTENLTDGKVTYSRTEISEFQTKDTYRTIETVVRDGKTIVTEAIQIGNARYCKENGAEKKNCYEQPPAPLGKADETIYAVQKDKSSFTYIRTASLMKKEADKAEPTKFLTQDRFVLNGDMSVRERSIVTTVNESKSIVSRKISKFEYGVTLKPIEAPIK